MKSLAAWNLLQATADRQPHRFASKRPENQGGGHKRPAANYPCAWVSRAKEGWTSINLCGVNSFIQQTLRRLKAWEQDVEGFDFCAKSTCTGGSAKPTKSKGHILKSSQSMCFYHWAVYLQQWWCESSYTSSLNRIIALYGKYLVHLHLYTTLSNDFPKQKTKMLHSFRMAQLPPGLPSNWTWGGGHPLLEDEGGKWFPD